MESLDIFLAENVAELDFDECYRCVSIVTEAVQAFLGNKNLFSGVKLGCMLVAEYIGHAVHHCP